MKAAGYYDAHSEYQRRVIETGDQSIASVIAGVDLDPIPGTFVIADYGAGTGATSVHAVKKAIATLRKKDADLPVLVVHNDVPTNDFSQLFRNVVAPGGYLELPGGPIYPGAVARSFFDQVLPTASVHAGMCSNAAHWFREQPRVRIDDGMYFADARGPARAALADQAARDWLAFVGARAAELAHGGRMLVQGIGTTEDHHVSGARLLRVMWEVAAGLADDGLLDRDTLERYVFPVYCRSVDEVKAPLEECRPIRDALQLVTAEIGALPNPYWEEFVRDRNAEAYAKTYVEFLRAFAESTLLTHLFEPGAVGTDPQALCDEFFERFRAATAADPDAGRYEAWIVRILFARRLERPRPGPNFPSTL